jgi:hypothetical protein
MYKENGPILQGKNKVEDQSEQVIYFHFTLASTKNERNAKALLFPDKSLLQNQICGNTKDFLKNI